MGALRPEAVAKIGNRWPLKQWNLFWQSRPETSGHGMKEIKAILNLTSILLIGHCTFFIWAMGEDKGWIDGSKFGWPIVAYFPVWAFVATMDHFANLGTAANRILFFLGGLIWWFAVGSYFRGTARRAK